MIITNNHIYESVCMFNNIKEGVLSEGDKESAFH